MKLRPTSLPPSLVLPGVDTVGLESRFVREGELVSEPEVPFAVALAVAFVVPVSSAVRVVESSPVVVKGSS